MPDPQRFDVVILGAGAAGMMCAMEAGQRGRSVALIDHADRAGKKILISGGGRCNFTNLHTRPENFISENPHFAKSALSRFTPEDMVALVEKHNIRYHEKTLGQLFCDRSALEMVTMMERECTAAGVHVFLGTHIESVVQADGFLIETSKGSFQAESLVVATGGLSIPKMGATGFGYTLAKQFGLSVVECRPGLVPLVFNEQDSANWCDLTGLSIEVVATTGAGKRPTTFREKMLITHRGLSGPAMLQISSYWQEGTTLRLDLAPDRNVTAPLLEHTRRDPGTALRALHLTFPGRLAERWFDQYPPADWTNASLAAMEQQIHNWQVTPAGTEGYTKAEVTAGGVDTAGLDAKTMQSRKVPGLFFIGEVVDVTGWLGGYNFQWAWASGVVAGQAA